MSDLDWQPSPKPPKLDDRPEIDRAFSDPISTPTQWWTWLVRRLELEFPLLAGAGQNTSVSSTTGDDCCVDDAKWWYGLGDPEEEGF